ncbi:MAG: Rieske 2Fe-2S domain-containing protein [Rhodospirillales bacterium]|nr:Rieske 2Fe-2S domain-containing protein [Rhodospirillales bacterium]
MEAPVADARGLPNEAFTDPVFLELERKHLFARSWVFACPQSDVPNPGDVKCLEVAGRHLFMTRDRKGAVRIFFNVCSHRGARLVIEDQTKATVLTCPTTIGPSGWTARCADGRTITPRWSMTPSAAKLIATASSRCARQSGTAGSSSTSTVRRNRSRTTWRPP